MKAFRTVLAIAFLLTAAFGAGYEWGRVGAHCGSRA